MVANGSPAIDKWVIGTLSLLAFGSSIVQFVWNGSRTDIAALEGRLDRAVAQLDKQLDELKANDKLLLPLSVHDEFKQQISRQILRNTMVLDDLSVRKEVFNQALIDQKTRDELVRIQHDKDIDMLRNRISALRERVDDLNKSLRK